MVEISIQKRPLLAWSSSPHSASSPQNRSRQGAQGARERYLRDDIACGSRACQRCHHLHADMQKTGQDAGLQKKIFLDPLDSRTTRWIETTTSCSTNAFLHQMDLIEIRASQTSSCSRPSPTRCDTGACRSSTASRNLIADRIADSGSSTMTLAATTRRAAAPRRVAQRSQR